MTLDELGERDGWTCWLCGGATDATVRAAGPASHGAPSIDHVVPTSRGGGNDPTNLRLAHRRCNSRRGNRLPELDWPAALGLLDPAPLWPAVRRARRRRGEWEVVAVVPTPDRTTSARAWLAEAVATVVPEPWESRTEALGETGLHALALRAVVGAPTEVPRASPGLGGPGGQRH